jgi:hypothetical protein
MSKARGRGVFKREDQMQFVLRIIRSVAVSGKFFPAAEYEEWDSLKDAERRASFLRKQGARVSIYQKVD